MFRDAKEIAGKKPNVLICDGMPTFNQAYLKELFIEEPNNKEGKQLLKYGDKYQGYE